MGSLAFQDAGGDPTNNMEEINAHPAVYTAAVINLNWSQLEPSQGVFDDSALVSALANIATYNAAYPSTPVAAKLRVHMGPGTPAWVIQATGPATLMNSTGATATIGSFWTPTFRTYWQALQAHLAGEYDGSSTIAEVAISSCSSLSDEPFITPLGAGAALLHQAGYTDALDQACLSGAAADYAAWKLTPLDYTFNTYHYTDSGSAVPDDAFPIQVMDAFRAALGTRGVVANHGLQVPTTNVVPPIYMEFQNLYNAAQAATPPTYSPLEFQTVSQSVDWPTTIALGLTYHPTEIEIWDTIAAGGRADVSLTELQGWAASLK